MIVIAAIASSVSCVPELRSVVPIPTLAPQEPTFAALGEGVLVQVGDCLWVLNQDGQTYSAIWPNGYRGRLDPAELLDSGGSVVVREGETFTFGGGLGKGEAPFCAGGAGVLLIGEIQVSPGPSS